MLKSPRPKWEACGSALSAAVVGKRINGASGWGGAVSAYVSQLTPERAVTAPLHSDILTDHVGALLALAAGCVAASPREQSQHGNMHVRIVDCIRQRSSELQLTATDVAASLGLSVRTLHRILASHGDTFGRRLIDARIQAAERMLRSRLFDQVTTSEIRAAGGIRRSDSFHQGLQYSLRQDSRRAASLQGDGHALIVRRGVNRHAASVARKTSSSSRTTDLSRSQRTTIVQPTAEVAYSRHYSHAQ
jgi:AraC-like DNA-binding protein